MIEVLDPKMAQVVVGSDYNPKFRYELETTDEGFHLIATDLETGEAQVRKLEDTNTESSHYDPLYDAERVDAIRTYGKQNMKGALLALGVCAILFGLLFLALYFILRGAG